MRLKQVAPRTGAWIETMRLKQTIIVLVVLLGMCAGTRAETISPLEPGLDSGVLLMIVTGAPEKIGRKTAVVASEIVTRDRYTVIWIEYSRDREIWLRSAVKAVKQYRREVIRIKLDRLSAGTDYYYRSVARSEQSMSYGSIYLLSLP